MCVSDEGRARDMLSDVWEIERLNRELKDLDRKISIEQSNLGNSGLRI